MSAEKVECRQEETLIVYRVKSRALFINNPLFILCVSTLPDAITRVAIDRDFFAQEPMNDVLICNSYDIAIFISPT